MKLPKMNHHKASGKARVVINGKHIYLGLWGSKEAEERYQAVISELVSKRQPTADERSALTINELILRYVKYAETYYVKNGKPTAEYDCIKSAMVPLRAVAGSQFAHEFGPNRMRDVRERMIDFHDWSLGYINLSVSRIRSLFKWCVGQELIRVSIYQALQTVEPLKKGRTRARETEKRQPATPKQIEAVLPYVSQRVRDLIELQLLTGARPGELCGLLWSEIDTSDDIWVANLDGHKTEHHGKDRRLHFGPRAQLILRRYLENDGPMMGIKAHTETQFAERVSSTTSNDGLRTSLGTPPRRRLPTCLIMNSRNRPLVIRDLR